ARHAVHKEVSRLHHENLLIFVDTDRTQSLWYWVKRQDGKLYPRDHHFFRGQPGDLFLSKINEMVFDLSEFDESGNVSIIEVTGRLQKALDVERVTKRFYGEFEKQHLEFMELIQGVEDEKDLRWYASVLLNRLMFIYFLQKKFFINNGDANYLRRNLEESQSKGKDRYFTDFLTVLFFEGFAKPESQRSAKARKLLGKIRYLNGGLFLPHKVEQNNPNLNVPDKAFENLYGLFERFSWNLDDTPGGQADEINPDVLGYIFEKYINQKAFGAYYTRPEITEYLCERTIHRLVLDAVNSPGIPGVIVPRNFESVGDMLMELDAPLCRLLLEDVLPSLSLLDPACGSGAFLVAAMKTLINLYSAIIGRIKFLTDDGLRKWLAKIEKDHASVSYFIKKRIITDNLFGVDIMEEAVEIAKLRLFLALVASARKADELEPLPHIDFNILPGNSLIGLMRVDEKQFATATGATLFRKSYAGLLAEKNRKIDTYRHTESLMGSDADSFTTLTALRDDIQKLKDDTAGVLDDMLLSAFTDLGIQFHQAFWDDRKNRPGRAIKRPLCSDDLHELKPFHWGYEFDQILNNRGGFDAIITNPPWEIFKPNAKEFFQDHSDLVTKKKMTIHEFKKEQKSLLKDSEIRDVWLEYLSGYPHVSAFFRSAPQYHNQISIVNGRKAGSDINLYKLFAEQCFNLLRPGGQCGIVIPSGIYTDLGTKQLRQMLYEQTEITGLFCIENRKEVFEKVHRSFKFVILTFAKGGKTKSFPAAFMRHDVAELDRFPAHGAVDISVDLVKRLSPDSLSVVEFTSQTDVEIATKTLRFPLFGEKVADSWNVKLFREFDMTNDSDLFKREPGKGRLPLCEGKTIWQFQHDFAEPRYWINEREGRSALFGRQGDSGEILPYQKYRLVHRRIASSTNERSLIATVLPPGYFCADTAQPARDEVDAATHVYLAAVFNSFVADYQMRKRITSHLDMHFMYTLALPRLTTEDTAFGPIVERAARLICTTVEFDDLAKEVGLGSYHNGATQPEERARLRAELDGLVAHLYDLTEEEFAYILTTFPLVPDPVKVAAQNAYRDAERGLIK
ncbi:MAG: ATP-binding protein, partial [Phycisphaerae bacterium]|nr:ATP-binding protein [Phycisphaerae bacterium]